MQNTRIKGITRKQEYARSKGKGYTRYSALGKPGGIRRAKKRRR